MKVQGSLLACLIASLSAGSVLAGEEYLATPAVDRAIYRDGQVRRTGATVGSWSVVCDEVVRLRQRFCSLEALGRDAAGAARVGLTISTADDGKPAALLRLPFGVLLDDGVEVSISPGAPAPKGRAQPVDPPMRLQVVTCDAKACLTAWGLTASQLAALNGAGAIKFRYRAISAGRLGMNLAPSAAPVEAVVSCRGFAEAVQATLK
ncbi:MAG TPA: invasion associated locus B family protein [Roseiarcus sp.]|nr:invasion associated locus B family protein [Roseiarcus sp.]